MISNDIAAIADLRNWKSDSTLPANILHDIFCVKWKRLPVSDIKAGYLSRFSSKGVFCALVEGFGWKDNCNTSEKTLSLGLFHGDALGKWEIKCTNKEKQFSAKGTTWVFYYDVRRHRQFWSFKDFYWHFDGKGGFRAICLWRNLENIDLNKLERHLSSKSDLGFIRTNPLVLCEAKNEIKGKNPSEFCAERFSDTFDISSQLSVESARYAKKTVAKKELNKLNNRMGTSGSMDEELQACLSMLCSEGSSLFRGVHLVSNFSEGGTWCNVTHPGLASFIVKTASCFNLGSPIGTDIKFKVDNHFVHHSAGRLTIFEGDPAISFHLTFHPLTHDSESVKLHWNCLKDIGELSEWKKCKISHGEFNPVNSSIGYMHDGEKALRNGLRSVARSVKLNEDVLYFMADKTHFNKNIKDKLKEFTFRLLVKKRLHSFQIANMMVFCMQMDGKRHWNLSKRMEVKSGELN